MSKADMNKKDSLRVPDYLDHILQAIERINRYVENKDESDFLQDEMLQDAVIRNIEIIGEAAKNVERIAPEFTAQYPDVPWAILYAMRNRVTHGYFDVDVELVWKTVRNNVPLLADQIRAVLDELGIQFEHVERTHDEANDVLGA